MDIHEQKAALRHDIKKILHNSPVQELSPRFFESVKAFAPYRQATTVLLYSSLKEEAPTQKLIDLCLADNKITALPKVRLSYAEKKMHKQQTADGMDFFILNAALPLCEQTETGVFGIAEPNARCPRLELCKTVFPLLIFIPGLAFTADGRRLGRGGGFYDRYCARLQKYAAQNAGDGCAPKAVYAGYCRSIQVVDTLPAEAHDLRTDFLITENGIQSCKI